MRRGEENKKELKKRVLDTTPEKLLEEKKNQYRLYIHINRQKEQYFSTRIKLNVCIFLF